MSCIAMPYAWCAGVPGGPRSCATTPGPTVLAGVLAGALAGALAEARQMRGVVSVATGARDAKIDIADQAKTSTIAVARNILLTQVAGMESLRANATANLRRTREASEKDCAAALEARMTLVKRDRDSIDKEIKPLLDMLHACKAGGESNRRTATGPATNTSSVTSLLEKAQRAEASASNTASATTAACLTRARTKLAAALSSTASQWSSQSGPDSTVDGNVKDWERRIQEETDEARAVHGQCLGAALSRESRARDAINANFNESKQQATQVFEAQAERMRAAATDQKAAAERTFQGALEAHAAAAAWLTRAQHRADDAAGALHSAETMKETMLAHSAERTEQRIARANVLAAAEVLSANRTAQGMRDDAAKQHAEMLAAKNDECRNKTGALDMERAKLQEILDLIASVSVRQGGAQKPRIMTETVVKVAQTLSLQGVSARDFASEAARTTIARIIAQNLGLLPTNTRAGAEEDIFSAIAASLVFSDIVRSERLAESRRRRRLLVAHAARGGMKMTTGRSRRKSSPSPSPQTAPTTPASSSSTSPSAAVVIAYEVDAHPSERTRIERSSGAFQDPESRQRSSRPA